MVGQQGLRIIFTNYTHTQKPVLSDSGLQPNFQIHVIFSFPLAVLITWDRSVGDIH